MRKYSKGLWGNSDFIKFWTGETLAMFGARVTALALPLVAALTLKATPMQMGFLNAAQFAPYILITLFAGVWIDRVRRRPLMIFSNVGRTILLGFIPLSFYFGFLHMEHLYVIGFLVGTLTVLFDISYQSYLPSLVKKDQLVEGNSKLEVSSSIAQVSGPGISGGLISIFSAPVVMFIHSFTLLISAYTLSIVRKNEAIPEKSPKPKPIVKEIKSGLKLVYNNSYLRAISGEAATFNMFNQVTWAVVILYMTKELGISPVLLGVIMATASIGSIIGSLIANYLGNRFKIGPTIVGTMVLACAAPLLIPLASGPLYVSVPILIVSFFFGGIGVVVSNIHVISLRQTITPDKMLGKMNAS
jgi:MFS family permease